MMPERKPQPSIQPLDPQSGAGSWRSPQPAAPIITTLPPVPPPNPLYLTADPDASFDDGIIDIPGQAVPAEGSGADGSGADHAETVDWAVQSSSPANSRDDSDVQSDSEDQFEAGWFEDDCAIADLLDSDAWSSIHRLQPLATTSMSAHESEEQTSEEQESQESDRQESDFDPDATTLYRRHTAGPLTYFNYHFEEVGSGTATEASPASSQWTWRLLGTGAVAATVVSGLMIGDAWQRSPSPAEPKNATAPPPSTDLTRSPAPLPQGSPPPTPAAASVAPERLPPAPTPSPTPGNTSLQAPAPEMPPLPRQAVPEMPMMPRVAPPEMVAIAPTPAQSPNLPPEIAAVRSNVPPPAAELRPALPPPPDMTPPPLPPPIVPAPAAIPPTITGAPAETTGERTMASLPQTGQRSGVRRNILQMSLAEAARYQAELAGEVPPDPSDAPPAAERGVPTTTPMPPTAGFAEKADMRAIPRSSEAAGVRRLFPARSPDNPAIPSGDRRSTPEEVPPPRVPATVPNSLPTTIPESAQSRTDRTPSDRVPPPLQRVVGIQDFVQLPSTASRAPRNGNNEGGGHETARPISILPLTEQAATEALETPPIQGFTVRSLPRRDYQREWATSNQLDKVSSAIAYPAFGFIDYQRQMIVVLQEATSAAPTPMPLSPPPAGQLPPQS